MKKIFSKEKFIEVEGYQRYQKSIEMRGMPVWEDECDGKTVEECNKLGFLISDDWCMEVEDEN